MRRIILLTCSFFLYIAAIAQIDSSATYDTIPQYRKDSTIPAFEILQAGNKWFRKNDLPKDTPIIIIFFSPDCGHCQLIAEDFSKNSEQFKDYFFVWMSYHPSEAIDSFARVNNLYNLPNVRIGRDTRYYIPVYYKIKYLPLIAAYDKHGKLIQVWDGGTEPKEILKVYQ